MNNSLRFLLIVLFGGVLVLAGSVLFVVREDQQALILQFGKPIGGAINEPMTRDAEPDTRESEAGLHFKLPWQNVVYFDRKNLEFDLVNPLEIIVANEERLLVDAFVRYRIVEPLQYYQTLGAGGLGAADMRRQLDNRLTSVLSESMRQALGEVQIRDIITTMRAQLMSNIQRDVAEEAQKLGVRIIDVRIRQADFPTENANNVYQRMISDYQQQAERIRANGERRAREVTATADKQVVEIAAQAEEEAQVIRGKGDATRNCILAGAYQGLPVEVTAVVTEADAEVLDEDVGEVTVPGINLDLSSPLAGVSQRQITCRFTDPNAQGDDERAEFFAFYRSLSAYERALRDGETTIVLSPSSEFFQYFNNQTADY